LAKVGKVQGAPPTPGKRAVDLLFEAEARGLTAAEVAEQRAALAEAKPEIDPLNPTR